MRRVYDRAKHTWLNEIWRKLLGGEFRDVVVFSSMIRSDVGQFRLAPRGGHTVKKKSRITYDTILTNRYMSTFRKVIVNCKDILYHVSSRDDSRTSCT